MFRRVLKNSSLQWRRDATNNSSNTMQSWDRRFSNYLIIGAAVFGVGYWAYIRMAKGAVNMKAEQIKTETDKRIGQERKF